MDSIDFTRLFKNALNNQQHTNLFEKRINCFLKEINNECPDKVRKLLFDLWEILYGPYFNEELAKEIVLHMVHNGDNGKEVWGELVTLEEASSMLPSELREKHKWNAYVAINGFVHDIARTPLNRKEAIKAGYIYFFEDDDFDEYKNKTWWYFRNL